MKKQQNLCPCVHWTKGCDEKKKKKKKLYTEVYNQKLSAVPQVPRASQVSRYHRTPDTCPMMLWIDKAARARKHQPGAEEKHWKNKYFETKKKEETSHKHTYSHLYNND